MAAAAVATVVPVVLPLGGVAVVPVVPVVLRLGGVAVVPVVLRLGGSDFRFNLPSKSLIDVGSLFE